MIKKIVKVILILIVILGISLAVLIGCGINRTMQLNRHMEFLQSELSPDGEHVFALFRGMSGMGDPSWAVFELDKNTKLFDLKIPTQYWSGQSEKDKYWQDRQVLWNYDEAGFLTENASIEIVRSQYLVFRRGGLYFGLYDAVSDQQVVSDPSPWHSWCDTDTACINEKGDISQDEYSKKYSLWVKENLHDKIDQILKESKRALGEKTLN